MLSMRCSAERKHSGQVLTYVVMLPVQPTNQGHDLGSWEECFAGAHLKHNWLRHGLLLEPAHACTPNA